MYTGKGVKPHYSDTYGFARLKLHNSKLKTANPQAANPTVQKYSTLHASANQYRFGLVQRLVNVTQPTYSPTTSCSTSSTTPAPFYSSSYCVHFKKNSQRVWSH